MVGEKKGGGVGIIMREKTGLQIEEIRLKEDGAYLGSGKGDIITVKLTEKHKLWWITVVYMGVEGTENRESNKKKYKALTEIKEKVREEKWIVMGDFNGHTGMKNEAVNWNGEMLLDYCDKTNMIIKNWEVENLTTWRGNGAETVIDYVLVNEAADKQEMRFWSNENIDISDHVMIGLNKRKTGDINKPVRKKEIAKWIMTKAQWSKYSQDINIAMERETNMENRTVDRWEKDIKGKILSMAKKHIGKKNVNLSGKKLKGWWDEEVKEAIHRRKEANRKQRKLKNKATEGKTTEEWQQKWKEYLTEKRITQLLIHSKITKWEKERADSINKLPRGARERESWKKLKENLTTPSTTNIKLKGKNGETENEAEIKEIIQNFGKASYKMSRKKR